MFPKYIRFHYVFRLLSVKVNVYEHEKNIKKRWKFLNKWFLFYGGITKSEHMKNLHAITNDYEDSIVINSLVIHKGGSS